MAPRPSSETKDQIWPPGPRRRRHLSGDLARGQRLYELLAAERFWCETCHNCHPLQEHRICRAG